MLNTLVILVLIAVVLWVGWTLWQNGWDFKKAGTALIAAALAAWLWVSDLFTALTSGL
jgi:hypothetical protein